MKNTDVKNDPNIDMGEVAKFDAIASRWWDKNGAFKPLHDINPLRLKFIKNNSAVKGKTILDVGCGGGILSEGLAKLGGNVTGIDMSPSALEIAKLHQYESNLTIDYKQTSIENFVLDDHNKFDIVTCMELLEHVPNPERLISSCVKSLKDEGQIFFSTLNRNVKAYLLGILGAEYVLNLLPKGTHDFSRFIKPSELNNWCLKSGLNMENIQGITYNPFSRSYQLSTDVSINYMCILSKK